MPLCWILLTQIILPNLKIRLFLCTCYVISERIFYLFITSYVRLHSVNFSCRNLRFFIVSISFHYRFATISFYIISPLTSCWGKAELYAVYPRKGDAMNLPWAGTGFMPYIPKQYMLSVHTAVLEGIAVFFHSTYSLPIPISPPICTTFFKTSAPALRRVRFFVVGKSLLLTFYQSRAPPSGPEFSVFKNFRTGGNQNED